MKLYSNHLKESGGSLIKQNNIVAGDGVKALEYIYLWIKSGEYKRKTAEKSFGDFSAI